jgi:gluconolactonase
MYFTDQGQSGLQRPDGRLFRLSASGKLDCLINNIPSPNGLTFNAAETDLLLAVTRANAIWRVRFFPDGNVSKSGTFIQMSGGLAGPDGLALDEQDNLLVCHMGMGSIWKFSRLGEPMLRIRSPKGILTSNCAFGGKDNKTLFITDSETASILAVDLDVPGKKTYALS